MFQLVYILYVFTAASAAEDKRLVMHSDLDLATTLGQLQKNLTEVGNKVLLQESRIAQLEAENQQFKAENQQFKAENQQYKVDIQQLNSSVTQFKADNQQLSIQIVQQITRVAQLETANQQQNAQVAQLETANQQQSARVAQLQTDNQYLKTHVVQVENTTRDLASSGKGSVYVRWGRNSCPGNGTDLIYKGIIGGTLYSSKGGASNSLCLPESPTWNKYVDGHDGSKSEIYGTEVEVDASFSTTAFGYNYHNQDPPCATCHTQRASVVMIPGRSNCYPGWTMEYTGYLVGGHPNDASSDYICLDSRPEELPHGLDSTSDDQHILFFVEAHCGSLPCPPYHDGREMACTVCSK